MGQESTQTRHSTRNVGLVGYEIYTIDLIVKRLSHKPLSNRHAQFSSRLLITSACC